MEFIDNLKDGKKIRAYFKILKELDESHLPVEDQAMHAAFKYFFDLGFNRHHTEFLVSMVIHEIKDIKQATKQLLQDPELYGVLNGNPLISLYDFNEQQQKHYERRNKLIDNLYRKFFK